MANVFFKVYSISNLNICRKARHLERLFYNMIFRNPCISEKSGQNKF